jgi:ATP-binding cassette subfamily B protein
MIAIGTVTGLAETLGITFLIATVFWLSDSQAELSQAIPVLKGVEVATGLSFTRGLAFAALIAAVISRVLLSLANGLWGAYFWNRICESVRNKLYDQVIDISMADVVQRDRGELMTILAAESYEVANIFSAIVRAGVSAVTIVIFTAALFVTSGKIALVACLIGIIHLAITALYSGAYAALGQQTSKAVQELTSFSWSGIQGFKSIRAFGVQRAQKKIFREHSARVAEVLLTSSRYQQVISALSEALVFASFFLIMVMVGMLNIPLYAAVTAGILLFRIQPHVRELTSTLLTLLKSREAVKRVAELLSQADKRYVEMGDKPISHFASRLEFKNVTYTYPGSHRPAISSMSFVIQAGSKVAIVGPSGAGKTTIVNLLLGLDRPDGGVVEVDGVNLNDISRADWRRIVAVSGQDLELIEGSVRDNITFFRLVSDEAMRRAAGLAGAATFIDRLPDTYDEWAGDEAIRFSGGQRQRLSVARGLACLPQILILDEATSGLDEDIESHMLDAILEEFADQTIILISHRRSAISKMDSIIDLTSPDLAATPHSREHEPISQS